MAHVTYVTASNGHRMYYRVMSDGTKKRITKEAYDRAKHNTTGRTDIKHPGHRRSRRRL